VSYCLPPEHDPGSQVSLLAAAFELATADAVYSRPKNNAHFRKTEDKNTLLKAAKMLLSKPQTEIQLCERFSTFNSLIYIGLGRSPLALTPIQLNFNYKQFKVLQDAEK